MKWRLHSGKVVEELLRKGEIEVKVPNIWIFDKSNIDEYLNLLDNQKAWVYIKSVNDTRSWKEIKNQVGKKSLFPSSWTYEEIAQAMKKAEEKIKDVLLNKYGLPEYSIKMQGRSGKQFYEGK